MRCSLNDIDKVSRVLMNKSIYPFTVEDGKKRFPLWAVLENNDTYVLMPNDGTVALFFRHGREFDFHFNALKKFRGDVAIRSAKSVISYMFYKTKCSGIFAIVPVIYKWATDFYSKIGMEKEGFARNKFLKNGKLNKQIIFSLNKEI